ncbi:MAG: tRNA 2-thiouridine(34) synthase MnmA [Syntrophobacterales bacterium]
MRKHLPRKGHDREYRSGRGFMRSLQPYKPNSKETVAVAVSGGVDSMVTAFLLKHHGNPVLALHMILRPEDSPEPGKQIRELTARLGVPLHLVDLRGAFQKQVIRPFVEAYRKGKTPNPCVVCNPRIKFSLLQEKATELGAKILATGHYARILSDKSNGSLRLFRGRDRAKDQSYFLYRLNQSQLARTFFPLGDYLKREVRQLAAEAGMGGYYRAESQEICFISARDYRDFLEQHLGSDLPGPGPVLDLENRQLGKHKGIHHYTIGQRRGIGIPSSAPYYVVGLEPDSNTVRVGSKSDLRRKELLVKSVNWIGMSPPSPIFEALVQVRSRHKEAPAVVKTGEEETVVNFLEPQEAITPGQSAVFYREDEVLGGGIIERVIS